MQLATFKEVMFEYYSLQKGNNMQNACLGVHFE